MCVRVCESEVDRQRNLAKTNRHMVLPFQEHVSDQFIYKLNVDLKYIINK